MSARGRAAPLLPEQPIDSTKQQCPETGGAGRHEHQALRHRPAAALGPVFGRSPLARHDGSSLSHNTAPSSEGPDSTTVRKQVPNVAADGGRAAILGKPPSISSGPCQLRSVRMTTSGERGSRETCRWLDPLWEQLLMHRSVDQDSGPVSPVGDRRGTSNGR